jgi:hypothetical protein
LDPHSVYHLVSKCKLLRVWKVILWSWIYMYKDSVAIIRPIEMVLG